MLRDEDRLYIAVICSVRPFAPKFRATLFRFSVDGTLATFILYDDFHSTRTKFTIDEREFRSAASPISYVERIVDDAIKELRARKTLPAAELLSS